MKLFRLFLRLIFLGLATTLFSTSVLAADVEITDSTAALDVIPQGQSNVAMLGFTVSTNAETTITEIRIQNTGTSVKFGGGVTDVYVYWDEDNDHAIDSNEEIVARDEDLSSGTAASLTFTLDSALTVSSANLLSLIVAYNIGSTAALEATTNVILTQITASNGTYTLNTTDVTDVTTPTSNEVTISGIDVTDYLDISPDVVLPGQTEVPFIMFQLQISGDGLSRNDNSTITITLRNTESNFLISGNSTLEDGIIAASLYATDIAIETADSSVSTIYSAIANVDSSSTTQLLQTVLYTDESEDGTLGTFLSSTRMNFILDSYPTDFDGLDDGVTQNFFITFDVGEDMEVTTNTVFEAQLYELTAIGDSSELENTWPLSGDTRQTASESDVGGLSLEDIDSIVPDDTFGAFNTIQMLSFELQANHTNITVNEITILNEQAENTSGAFVTEETSTDGIVKIQVYLDNGNSSYSSSTDTLVGEISNDPDDTQHVFSDDISAVIHLDQNGSFTTPNGVLIEADQSQIFFVLYESGNIQDSATAEALLGSVYATATITVGSDTITSTVDLSLYDDDSPASSTPNAEVDLTETITLSVQDVQDISSTNVYLGQTKVPMLYIEVISSEEADDVDVTIHNEGLSFLDDSSGVSKVWLYRDEAPYASFGDEDEFLAGSSSYTDSQTITFGDFTLENSVNYFLVLYDIGLSPTNIGSSSIIAKAQLNGFSTGTVAGELPQPVVAAVVERNNALVTGITIETSDDTSDAAVTLDFTLAVENTSTFDITIETLAPRIYLDDISGSDISYEFAFSDDSDLPETIASGASLTLNYEIRHVTQISDGPAVVDAVLEYSAADILYPSDSTVYVSRYDNTSAVASTVELELNASYTERDWVFSPHIDSVQYERGGTQTDFSQGQALKETDDIIITFVDSGSFIDEASITVALNGTTFTRDDNDSLISNDYEYNEETGVLTLTDIGDTDGTFVISATDGTNALEDSEIYFIISEDKVEISNVLFYPNPYPMGSQDLILGYYVSNASSSTPVEVEMYLYDHNGVLVFDDSQFSTATGYDQFSIDVNTSSIAPGIYICKLVAEDDDGNQAVKVTRLSVY